MNAMIFAAGIGSRLKPFTESHPKSLVPVCGVPMLERVVLKLKQCGVKRIVVNVHHFSSQIIDFLKSKENFGCDIAISNESGMLLDTGGGLLSARCLFESSSEPIVVHNADILTDFRLEDMLECHLRSGADATLLVARRKSSRMLYFDDDNRLKGWQNLFTGECKPSGFRPDFLNPLAFGGVQIVNTSIFDMLDNYAANNGCVFSIIPFFLSSIDVLQICGYEPRQAYSWHDIGTPEKLEAACRDFDFPMH